MNERVRRARKHPGALAACVLELFRGDAGSLDAQAAAFVIAETLIGLRGK